MHFAVTVPFIGPESHSKSSFPVHVKFFGLYQTEGDALHNLNHRIF